MLTWVETRRKLRNHITFDGREDFSTGRSDSSVAADDDSVADVRDDHDEDEETDDSTSSESFFLLHSVGTNATIYTHER